MTSSLEDEDDICAIYGTNESIKVSVCGDIVFIFHFLCVKKNKNVRLREYHTTGQRMVRLEMVSTFHVSLLFFDIHSVYCPFIGNH
jgi:hypothetical protein